MTGDPPPSAAPAPPSVQPTTQVLMPLIFRRPSAITAPLPSAAPIVTTSAQMNPPAPTGPPASTTVNPITQSPLPSWPEQPPLPPAALDLPPLPPATFGGFAIPPAG